MKKGKSVVSILLMDKNLFFVNAVKYILTDYLSKEGLLAVFENSLNKINRCQIAIIGMSFFLNYKLVRDSGYNVPTIFWMEPVHEQSIGSGVPDRLSFQVSVDEFLNQFKSKNINIQGNISLRDRVKDKSKFTRIECEVIRHYVEGVNNKKSAQILGITGKTLSRYKMNAMAKLNVRHNGEFMLWLLKSYDHEMRRVVPERY